MAKAHYCRECSGTGINYDDKSKTDGANIDGDPVRMQEIFHIMADARETANAAKAADKLTQLKSPSGLGARCRRTLKNRDL